MLVPTKKTLLDFFTSVYFSYYSDIDIDFRLTVKRYKINSKHEYQWYHTAELQITTLCNYIMLYLPIGFLDFTLRLATIVMSKSTFDFTVNCKT